MPKKGKRSKNSKNKRGSEPVVRALEYPTDDQICGVVTQVLGNCFFTVLCTDDKSRRCKIRRGQTRRIRRITTGDVLIVSLRSFDDSSGDIIHRYNDDDLIKLRREGIIPDSEAFGGSTSSTEHDSGFVFADVEVDVDDI